MSRAEELQVTENFARHLNVVTKEQYVALPEPTEASDADTYLGDNLGVLIPVQNVTSEGNTLKNAAVNTRAMQNDDDFRVENVDHHEWIKAVLRGKEKKHYSNACELIILIRGSLPTPTADYISKLAPIDASFAGVYYVSMPTTHPKSNYVVALKEYWKTPTIF